MVDLEANPDFFAGAPAIDRLTLKFGSAAGIRGLESPHRGDPMHFVEHLWIDEEH